MTDQQTPDLDALTAAVNEFGDNLVAAARAAWARVKPALTAAQDEYALVPDPTEDEQPKSDRASELRDQITETIRRETGRRWVVCDHAQILDFRNVADAVMGLILPDLDEYAGNTREQRQRADQAEADRADLARRYAALDEQLAAERRARLATRAELTDAIRQRDAADRLAATAEARANDLRDQRDEARRRARDLA